MSNTSNLRRGLSVGKGEDGLSCPLSMPGMWGKLSAWQTSGDTARQQWSAQTTSSTTVPISKG